MDRNGGDLSRSYRWYQKHYVKSPIKWPGGKLKLIPELTNRIPSDYGRYIEPFFGGGALYFSQQPAFAYLSDTNAELINFYVQLRDKVDQLIPILKTYRYEKDYYYAIRNVDRTAGYQRWEKLDKAARFYYLNKTCFNGLWRVNSRGEFNVPIGRYKNPNFCDEDLLRAASDILYGSKLKCCTFRQCVSWARLNDFVYFDPPYLPVSETAKFTAYTKTGFRLEDHHDLKRVCVQLDKIGCRWMQSNSDSPTIRAMYRDYNIEVVQCPRSINSKVSKRGAVNELIIRNYG